MPLLRVKVATLSRMSRLRLHGQVFVRHCLGKKTASVFALFLTYEPLAASNSLLSYTFKF